MEHFLEDGVAPPVIGGGPPESPFDVEPEPGSPPPGRHAQPRQQQYRQPDHQAEPPTSPIPVVRRLPREPEEQKRKSWVSRMFRLPEK